MNIVFMSMDTPVSYTHLPGTTNACLVSSMQSDPFFEIYSAPEERSGAYMACGMAAEGRCV